MEREELQLTMRMTPSQAREFADRLAEDDAFRERLTNDPQGALSEYGIEIGGALVPETVTLPEKEQVVELREAIQAGQEIRLEPEFKPSFHPGLLLVLAIAAHE